MAKSATAVRPSPTAYSELDLSGEYVLTSPKVKTKAKIALPGDVHTALLEAGEIPDPYFGANEQVVMWVHDTPWTMERRFTADASDIDGYLTLTLESVDCIATVLLNGEEVARTQNQFIRYDIDVTGKVRAGTNTLRLEFDRPPGPGPLLVEGPDPAHQRPARRAHELRAQGRLPCRLGLGHLPDADRRLRQDGDPQVPARAAGERSGRAGAREEFGRALDHDARLRVCRRLGGTDARDGWPEARRQGRRAAGREPVRPQPDHQEPETVVAERAGRADALRTLDHARRRADPPQDRSSQARMECA